MNHANFFFPARPRVHQVQCQVRPLSPPERGPQGARSLCSGLQGDAGEVHHWRREAAQCVYEAAGKATFAATRVSVVLTMGQDPEIQKATGETDPVAIMTKLREMKNNFK